MNTRIIFLHLLAYLFYQKQIIKFSIDKIDGNFYRTIIEAKEKELIDDMEFQLLDFLREIRNKIFHESHYPTGLEINGIFWSFSEDETKQLVYEKFSLKIFQLVFKLVK